MKLTQEQIEWVRKEQEKFRAIIASKPELGLFVYISQLQALDMISAVHNIAVRAEKKANEARVAELKKKVEEKTKT